MAARCARASKPRAMSAGATRAYVVDARERFITDYVWPHLQANALYQGAYPLATALARPLIAQLLVEVAKREGADAVAHGCTGKGNDQVRFDVATHALDPGLEVIAPMRVGMGLTRDQEIDYANERGIEIPITKASPYSIDVNLWGRSCETGVLEDPWVTPPPDAYEWTVAPSDAPAPVELVIEFEGGIPVALDGERLERGRRSSSASTTSAAPTASAASTTSRTASSASRAARSTRRPAATILHAAHHALEGLTLSRDTLRFNRFVADELARLDLRRPVVQRPVARPALVRGVVAAGRVGRGPGPARSRPGRRRRPALAAVAVRQEPRHVRRGRCLRPRVGGRVHRDLRPAAAGRGGAPRRRRQAPRCGLDVDRSPARRAADDDRRSGARRRLGRLGGRPDRRHPASMETMTRTPGLDSVPSRPIPDTEGRLRELAFLHDIAQLATLARDWDELMRTIVDGTTAALGVEVCSFYLPDHERTRLTLVATNGLDRGQVGKVSLAWGQGITGRVAATQEPIAVEDVTEDERFAWVRGFDVETLRGMLSVPLVWHDSGGRRPQRPDARLGASSIATEIGVPPDDRGPAGRHRREGPPDRRGRGAARAVDRARRRAVGAAVAW